MRRALTGRNRTKLLDLLKRHLALVRLGAIEHRLSNVAGSTWARATVTGMVYLNRCDVLAHSIADQSRKGTKRKAASAKPRTRKRSKVAPKYRSPKGETWTGRGLAPRWLAALEAQGKKRESFLIKK